MKKSIMDPHADIFAGLDIPSDKELRYETRIAKMSITKTGAPGTKHTAETKRKIGLKSKGRKMRPRTEKERADTSEFMRNRVITPEHCANISIGLLGHPVSDSRKLAISNGLTGVMKGVPKKTCVCPHCGLEGGIAPMTRSHFDKCSLKDNKIVSYLNGKMEKEYPSAVEIQKDGFDLIKIRFVAKSGKNHMGRTWKLLKK
jgi:hypothetical protein